MSRAIIHFHPIEQYPPTINFLRILSKQGTTCTVYTSQSPYFNEISFPQISFVRSTKLSHPWKYIIFYLKTLLSLITTKPTTILYYESLSAYPALIYKKFLNPRVKLMVHYHEYTSPIEYHNGSKLSLINYNFERHNLKLFSWISHTNETRAKLYAKDLSYPTNLIKSIPNYPPTNWKIPAEKPVPSTLKIIYMGYNVCPISTYIDEFVKALNNQNEEVIFDLYLIDHSKVPNFENLNPKLTINFHKAIPYDDIPSIMKKYHFGVILYKGLSPNSTHIAPNKLFEYLVCGCQVIYANKIKGINPYRLLYPQYIQTINFDETVKLNLHFCEVPKIEFSAESALTKLVNEFTK